jgi:3-deoxy-D-manno-octulosonic-acid transferase
MPYLLNGLYLVLVVLASPWLVYKSLTTGKYRRGLWRKLVGHAMLRDSEAPCAWFHGVSVGEVHLLGPVVSQFRRRHPDWECVVSTTTDTGFDEACKRFPDLPVCYWPLDFSWAVHRALRRINPSLVVLAEGELWPNFLRAARWRGVPVAIVNARMSPRSYRHYAALGRLVRPLFTSIDCIAAQTQEYAESYRRLGAMPARVHVTGSVKYDGVCGDRDNLRTQELARLLAVQATDFVWIAGSTQAPEEVVCLDAFRQLQAAQPNVRLFLVPRQRERFGEVAGLLKRSGLPFVRRSELSGPLADRRAVVLIDTIGELGALWGLADVAFVGGSLDGRRGGQNMIEPAAYGAAVVFGPHVWNFRDAATRLVAADAAVQIRDAAFLPGTILRLLSDGAERCRLGEAARRFVLSQQGATERTVECLDRALRTAQPGEKAA